MQASTGLDAGAAGAAGPSPRIHRLCFAVRLSFYSTSSSTMVVSQAVVCCSSGVFDKSRDQILSSPLLSSPLLISSAQLISLFVALSGFSARVGAN